MTTAEKLYKTVQDMPEPILAELSILLSFCAER
jgi:hypothetical protein